MHKTANVLNKVPKSVQPKVKAALHEIWMAETRESAYKAFDRCVRRFEAKYPKATECLVKDKDAMLAFYDFPAVHWQHIRTTNPIEPVFATVRLRTTKTRNCGSRMTTLAMVWKLMETAQNQWRRLRGYKLLAGCGRGSDIQGWRTSRGILRVRLKQLYTRFDSCYDATGIREVCT